ncbi:clathrin interactor EPSIN 1 isoform X1 [Selaginella moellendorffii]|uniref:clathrin interactor EPSIN 1 isoform X1 n=1 Tax=Selaginella moellendorffii TaxID=88036 RepID=UPI000D1CA832|nr:clathrin interactor EPSIN 1 isoform X1 [Selaginella moellendorffii]|eukprot:XP_024545710.1 clathrin interactor EPSIN 1 isoform X1 [Selaginella moellendorffii]
MVALLNDRQRINDVRKKAAVNKNKYQGVGSNPAAEKPSGRLEDDDWQKPMQQQEWSQQSSSSTSTQGGSPENFASSRGPPPSYEEAMRSSIPVDEGFDEFDPRGAPPSSATGFANPSSFQMNPQMSSTNPNASSISNFAPPAAAAFPPLQGSSDKVENAFRAGHMSFKPPSR